MRLDLHAGIFYSDREGYGRVTAMYDRDGDETLEPRECFVAEVDFPGQVGARRVMRVRVRLDEDAEAVN